MTRLKTHAFGKPYDLSPNIMTLCDLTLLLVLVSLAHAGVIKDRCKFQSLQQIPCPIDFKSVETMARIEPCLTTKEREYLTLNAADVYYFGERLTKMERQKQENQPRTLS